MVIKRLKKLENSYSLHKKQLLTSNEKLFSEKSKISGLENKEQNLKIWVSQLKEKNADLEKKLRRAQIDLKAACIENLDLKKSQTSLLNQINELSEINMEKTAKLNKLTNEKDKISGMVTQFEKLKDSYDKIFAKMEYVFKVPADLQLHIKKKLLQVENYVSASVANGSVTSMANLNSHAENFVQYDKLLMVLKRLCKIGKNFLSKACGLGSSGEFEDF